MARNSAWVRESDNGPIDGYITVVVYYWKLNYNELLINTVWVHTGTIDHHDLMVTYTCYNGCGAAYQDARGNAYSKWTRARYYCDELPKNQWYFAGYGSGRTHTRGYELEVFLTNRNFGSFDCLGYRGEEFMVELLLT